MNQIQQSTQLGIRTEFLNLSNYKTTLQFSQKRHECYLKYCALIKSYYNDFENAAKHLSERIKIAPNDQLESIKQFKQHLIDFVKAIEEVAIFKIDYYNQVEDTELDPIRRPTDEMMFRAGKYQSSQNRFVELLQKNKSNDMNLLNLYAQTKKDVKNASVYFDQKYTKPRVQQIQGLIKSKGQIEAQANSELEIIYKNTTQFESDIYNYRQKLISSKYKTHKKIIQMSKGARECLTQTLITIFQILYQRQVAFQGLLRQSMKESTLLFNYKRKANIKIQQNIDRLTQIIINATQEYNDLINGVQGTIKHLMEGLTLISINYKEKIDSSKSLSEELNKLYENNENPSPQMLDTLDLFSYFCQKIGEIPTLLNLQLSSAIKLRQNINKHSDITLSLIKCATYKGKMEPINSVNNQNNKNLQQLNHLFDQLSYDYINDIMEKVIKSIEETLSKLKIYFNSKYHKKKKNRLEDSMDISHIEEEQPHPEKRPSKQELWIWKQFRNAEKYRKIIPDVDQLKEITKFIQPFLQIKIDSEKEVDKFNCSLNQKKEVKGVLKILEKNILFSSSNNEIDINIPLDYVCQVVAKIKTFEKELSIVTGIGQINFAHIPQISKAEVLMQQQINTNAASKQSTKKISVEVATQQIEFIKNRRQKIQAELEPLDGYEEKCSILLQNTTVDAVYDLAYSDKPFKYKGKEECCYFAYILKKSNGSNFTTTKYNPPGPKFYSLEDGRTFSNTPLFSTRNNQYEVPMPPIPFMPKTCINNEIAKLFWISNEEFDYYIKSQTRGAPFADTFNINILHRIVKKEQNVEIKIFYKIVFVKNGGMRGTITSKSSEEVKEKSEIFLAETAKILKQMGAGTSGGKDGARKEDPEQNNESEKSVREHPKMKKLENQNKILVGVLVAIILINLILRLF